MLDGVSTVIWWNPIDTRETVKRALTPTSTIAVKHRGRPQDIAANERPLEEEEKDEEMGSWC